jgi:hypothetical protein
LWFWPVVDPLKGDSDSVLLAGEAWVLSYGPGYALRGATAGSSPAYCWRFFLLFLSSTCQRGASDSLLSVRAMKQATREQ